jgi:hypothetical protein
MFLADLFDLVFVQIPVPYSFGIDDGDRAFVADTETAGIRYHAVGRYVPVLDFLHELLHQADGFLLKARAHLRAVDAAAAADENMILRRYHKQRSFVLPLL